MPDLTTVAACKAWIGGIPNGEILDPGITAEGTGYHAATTTLGLTGVLGQGTGFAADPVIEAGKIVGIVIRDPGRLYLKDTPPTLVATDTDGSPGSGAVFTLVSTTSTPRIATIDSTADALLARLVTAASAFFAQRCARAQLINDGSTITEVRDGQYGQRRMVTIESPIAEVVSLSLDGKALTASTGPVNPGYGFDPDGVFLRGSCFTGGFSNVTIAYKAGYATNSPEAAMIEQAVIELVAQKYKRQTHVDEVSRSVSATGSTTATFSTKDVPAEVQVTINKFSRPMVFGA
jgi:hypothetical protein